MRLVITPSPSSESVLFQQSSLRPRKARAQDNGAQEKRSLWPSGTRPQVAGIVIKAPQKSLSDWGKQDWTTKSGKKSSETGERYLPKAAIKSLSPAEYAATTKAKRAGKAAGKQFVAQPKKIAQKTAKYRF
jgi:hypothetical protein